MSYSPGLRLYQLLALAELSKDAVGLDFETDLDQHFAQNPKRRKDDKQETLVLDPQEPEVEQQTKLETVTHSTWTGRNGPKQYPETKAKERRRKQYERAEAKRLNRLTVKSVT